MLRSYELLMYRMHIVNKFDILEIDAISQSYIVAVICGSANTEMRTLITHLFTFQ